MKKSAIFSVLIFLAALISSGCNDNTSMYDEIPPNRPTNVDVLASDNRVDLIWDHVRDRDLAGYNVYISYDDYEFELIGSTQENYFIDDYAVNGDIYYYAVTAYDFNGNESSLSIEKLIASPRPEGYDQILYDYIDFPEISGFSFANETVYPYDNRFTDFFFENYYGEYYIDVWDDTDIIDMGPTNDIYDITVAPDNGWSETKDAVARVGHTYVIWTVDGNYAKLRISQITPERIVFDWAYQLNSGLNLLKNSKHGTYAERIIDKDDIKNRRK